MRDSACFGGVRRVNRRFAPCTFEPASAAFRGLDRIKEGAILHGRGWPALQSFSGPDKEVLTVCSARSCERMHEWEI